MHGTLQFPWKDFLMSRERFFMLLKGPAQIIENKPSTCKTGRDKAAPIYGPEDHDHAGWNSISSFSNVTKF